MAQVIADELSRADAAFSGNRLLTTFSNEDRALIEAFGSTVSLKSRQVIFDRDEALTTSLFPVGPTMISMSVELSGGRTVEVASIGREGAVGGIVSCGHAPAFSRAWVLVPGPAFMLPLEQLEDAKRRSRFVEHIFCRFSDYLLAQVMQSAACNAYHSIVQRAARWLLHAQDRAGDRIELTQEAFAGLLGVQRTTVNAAIQELVAAGLIKSGRGTVSVVDRAGLKRRACECYERLEQHFGAVIGPGGSGG